MGYDLDSITTDADTLESFLEKIVENSRQYIDWSTENGIQNYMARVLPADHYLITISCTFRDELIDRNVGQIRKMTESIIESITEERLGRIEALTGEDKERAFSELAKDLYNICNGLEEDSEDFDDEGRGPGWEPGQNIAATHDPADFSDPDNYGDLSGYGDYSVYDSHSKYGDPSGYDSPGKYGESSVHDSHSKYGDSNGYGNPGKYGTQGGHGNPRNLKDPSDMLAAMTSQNPDDTKNTLKKEGTLPDRKLVFSSLDEIITFTGILKKDMLYTSSLYKTEDTYVLLVRFDQCKKDSDAVHFILAAEEYGGRCYPVRFDEAYMMEHGKVLIKENALDSLSMMVKR